MTSEVGNKIKNLDITFMLVIVYLSVAITVDVCWSSTNTRTRFDNTNNKSI